MAFEKAWRLNGALMDRSRAAYDIHSDNCSICPELEGAASHFESDTLCEVGLTLLQAATRAERDFHNRVIEQGTGTFMGLSNGLVIFHVPDRPMEQVVDHDTHRPVNWINASSRSRAFQVMAHYAAWDYDMVDAKGWVGKARWRSIARALKFDDLCTQALAPGAGLWGIKEDEIRYELAAQLHSETSVLLPYQLHDATEASDVVETDEDIAERECHTISREAFIAFARIIKQNRHPFSQLIDMAKRHDAQLLRVLDEADPGISDRVLHLTPHWARRIWWVLKSVELTRPETAPDEALASRV
ncbi:MAG: hypothetical protein ACYCZN_01910 [Candidatus Dormibacteria bacterium]